MYNIKQAAARSGVSVPLLRAWERRYGIVEPARTAAGYRQFDDAAIARLRAMRELVETGWSPSAAAAAILAGTAPAADPLPDPAVAAPIADDGDLGARFVDGAAALAPAAIEVVLDELFSRGSFERVATDLLFPALRVLGDAWAAGRVSVAGEHMASAAVLRRLGLAFDVAARKDGRGDRVIVGLPPGGRHELGALAFAVAASRAGLAVTYLGPDLPVDDWVAAASGAAAAVIGVVGARDRGAAAEVAARLRATNPELVIAFGGPAARESPEAIDALRLADGLPAAVDALVAALA